MRLRPRFTLWFSLAALAPIAVAAVVTRDVVSQSYTDEFARTRRAAETTVARERAGLEEGVLETLSSLQRHPLVDGVFVEYEKHGTPLPPQIRRDIKRRAGDYLRGLGLDVLTLVERDDVVLAAPHYRPAQDSLDTAPRQRASARAGQAYYAREPAMREGAIATILTVSSAKTFESGRHRLTVVVGQEVDTAILDTVRQPGRIDARVVTPAGEVVIPGTELPASAWRGVVADVVRLPLPGPDGAPTAVIEIAISRADLERLLVQVTTSALVLAGTALLITVLLGVFVARRMTSDLDRLVEGAHAAARGDLDHRVDVRTRDEIGALAASFNQMLEELKTSKERLVMAERIAAWQEIARRLAHEIKNPLTPIQMAVETMRKTWRKKHPSFEEIFEESTATVLEESARLKRIVSEFAQFARMPKPALEACDLNDIITTCLSLYGGGEVAIERELAPALAPIRADRDQLQQVLINLLENARDALADAPDALADAPAPQITIRTAPGRRAGRADYVVLTVEDNGPGLPADIKDKLFTPYFTTKHAHGGTGLGLAIVHRIVSDHDGRIRAEDNPRGGARFVVELPTDT
ncbi:MAG: hypothetical protein Tsb0020_55020 [Haliangiales bacterium]